MGQRVSLRFFFLFLLYYTSSIFQTFFFRTKNKNLEVPTKNTSLATAENTKTYSTMKNQKNSSFNTLPSVPKQKEFTKIKESAGSSIFTSNNYFEWQLTQKDWNTGNTNYSRISCYVSHLVIFPGTFVKVYESIFYPCITFWKCDI